MKHRLEQRSGFPLLSQAKLCLGVKKLGGRLLPELKVVIEKKHSREGGREVVNFRRLFLELPAVCKQVAEELPRFFPLAEFFAR